MLGSILLVLQVLLLVIQFLFSHLFNVFTTPFLIFLVVIGLILSTWSGITLGIRSYSPLPTPRRGNYLKLSGPYRYIRHPLYLGLIFISVAFFLSRITFFTACLFSAFLIATDLKANFEEKLMIEKHPQYLKYRKAKKKYLPFLM